MFPLNFGASQVVKDSKEASGKALLNVQPLVERAKNQHSKVSRRGFQPNQPHHKW